MEEALLQLQLAFEEEIRRQVALAVQSYEDRVAGLQQEILQYKEENSGLRTRIELATKQLEEITEQKEAAKPESAEAAEEEKETESKEPEHSPGSKNAMQAMRNDQSFPGLQKAVPGHTWSRVQPPGPGPAEMPGDERDAAKDAALSPEWRAATWGEKAPKEVKKWFRANVDIYLRPQPKMDARWYRQAVRRGEWFEVDGVQQDNRIQMLRLKDGRGWVPNTKQKGWPLCVEFSEREESREREAWPQETRASRQKECWTAEEWQEWKAKERQWKAKEKATWKTIERTGKDWSAPVTDVRPDLPSLEGLVKNKIYVANVQIRVRESRQYGAPGDKMLQPGEVFEVDASTVDGSVKMLRREEGGWVPLVEPNGEPVCRECEPKELERKEAKSIGPTAGVTGTRRMA
ncbi:unnamed protein product [Effrenium voratum]|nr:unnamed protein product [Effrenium voratum]